MLAGTVLVRVPPTRGNNSDYLDEISRRTAFPFAFAPAIKLDPRILKYVAAYSLLFVFIITHCIFVEAGHSGTRYACTNKYNINGGNVTFIFNICSIISSMLCSMVLDEKKTVF